MPFTRAQAKLKKLKEAIQIKSPVRAFDFSIELEPLPKEFDYSRTVSASDVERAMSNTSGKFILKYSKIIVFRNHFFFSLFIFQNHIHQHHQHRLELFRMCMNRRVRHIGDQM